MKKCGTDSSMESCLGISDQRRAYLTGVTGSCGSRSTCMCSSSRQNEARNSYGNASSAMHLQHISVHTSVFAKQFVHIFPNFDRNLIISGHSAPVSDWHPAVC